MPDNPPLDSVRPVPVLLVGPRFFGKSRRLRRQLGYFVGIPCDAAVVHPRLLLGHPGVVLESIEELFILGVEAHHRFWLPFFEATAVDSHIALTYNAPAHDEAALRESVRRLPAYLTRRITPVRIPLDDPWEHRPPGWSDIEIQRWSEIIPRLLTPGGIFGEFTLTFERTALSRPGVREGLATGRAPGVEAEIVLEAWDLDAKERPGKLGRLFARTLLQVCT